MQFLLCFTFRLKALYFEYFFIINTISKLFLPHNGLAFVKTQLLLTPLLNLLLHSWHPHCGCKFIKAEFSCWHHSLDISVSDVMVYLSVIPGRLCFSKISDYFFQSFLQYFIKYHFWTNSYAAKWDNRAKWSVLLNCMVTLFKTLFMCKSPILICLWARDVTA